MSNPIITNTKKVLDVNEQELTWIRNKYEQKKGLQQLERPEMIPESNVFAFSPQKTQQNRPYELRPLSSFREISETSNSNKKIPNYNLQEENLNLTTLFDTENTFTQTVTNSSINSLIYSEMNSSVPNILKNVNDSLDLAKKRSRNTNTTKKTKNKIYNPNYYKLFKNAFDEQEKSSNKTSSLLSFSSEF
jgi:hypothetical protein